MPAGRIPRHARTLRLLPWLGALLCAALLIIWWASQSYSVGVFIADRYILVEDGQLYMMVFIHGCRVREYRWIIEPLSGPTSAWQPQPNPPPASSPWFTRHHKWPFWYLLVVPCVATVYLAVRYWRLVRPLKGHCRSCGYDLTGNTSGVCPECGSDAPRGEHSRGAAANDNG